MNQPCRIRAVLAATGHGARRLSVRKLIMNLLKDLNLLEDAFIGVRIEDGAAVATVLCSSVRERQSSILRQTLDHLANSNGGRVLLDLCGVTNLSAACISNILSVQHACDAMGGKFVVFGLVGELADSLRQTGVLKQINLADDEAQARRVLSGKPSRHGLLGLFRRDAA
ncbi:MAG: STAS domain-containing protein [Phycisphaerales bacterium]